LLAIGSGTLRAYPDDCYASKPTARDLQQTAIVNEISLIQLKDQNQKGIDVYIQELPKNGILFQYDKKLKTAPELFASGIPISQPSLVSDKQGRVLYLVEGSDKSKGATVDSFVFVLSKDSVKSNLGTVSISIRPAGTARPGPAPQPKTKGPSMLVTISLAVGLILLLLVLSILVFFLYKKNHTGTEVVEFVKETVTGAQVNSHMDNIRAGSTLIEGSVDSDDLDSD